MASKKDKQIAVRLNDEQMERLNRVFAVGSERTLGEADHSTMLRELIGIIPFRILKEEDRLLLKDDPKPIAVKLRLQAPKRPSKN